jgi:hypothetical protein
MSISDINTMIQQQKTFEHTSDPMLSSFNLVIQQQQKDLNAATTSINTTNIMSSAAPPTLSATMTTSSATSNQSSRKRVLEVQQSGKRKKYSPSPLLQATQKSLSRMGGQSSSASASRMVVAHVHHTSLVVLIQILKILKICLLSILNKHRKAISCAIYNI